MSRKLVEADWVCQHYGWQRWRVYDLVKQKILPAVRVGRRIYFDPVQLETWIEAGGRTFPAEQPTKR